MNMIVNHQITLSEENKIYTGKGSENTGNNIDDIISDLSDIIFQMNILFKKIEMCSMPIIRSNKC